jgi:tetratricopeptide (TPR) repeat protein
MTAETGGQRRALRTPSFVGREEAKRALEAAIERALRFGAPQFVTIVGGLGMGKTRFLNEWSAACERRDMFRVVRASARRPAPEMTADPGEMEPFGLLAGILRDRFGIPEDAEPEQTATLFGAELRSVFGDRRVAEVAGLLGRFLGLGLPESPLGQALVSRPDQEADLARAVLCRFLEADAALRPLIIAIDDVHLADDRTLDVFEQMAGELGEAPIVFVANTRPELYVRRPGWGRGPGSQARLDLSPLSRLEMDVFVRSVLDADALAPGLAERAAIESGGNPYLLLRLLGAYQLHGVLLPETDRNWWFDQERAPFVSLELEPEASAQSRVAHLGPAERDLLTRGAAFGAIFWTGGVVALGRLSAEPPDPTAVFAPDPSIEEARTMLGRLAESNFVMALPASTVPGEAEWSFCNEIERNLLLGSLDPELGRRRRRFAAQWLEGRLRLPQNSERLELLGNLYQEGGDVRRAGQCFLLAGDAAVRRLRHERARGLFLRGVELLDVDDSVRKMDAYHKLGDVSARLGRAHEALGHFGDMLRIAWRLDLPGKGGAAHARIGRLYRALGDFRRALSHLELANTLFELAADRPGIAAVHDDTGRVHLLKGNLDESMSHHRQALQLREQLGDERGRALTMSWMGLVEMQRGNLLAAGDYFNRSLALGRTTRDAHGIVFALLDLGRLERIAGQPAVARARLEEARSLARQMGERLYQCYIGLEIGECLLCEGKAPAAEAEFSAVRTTAQQFGAKRLAAEGARALAEARLAQGDVIGARDHAAAALGLAESMGASPLAGAALRVLASAVANGAPGDADHGGAREMFDRAVELLEGLGAELELGRALRAYADYEDSTGRGDAASELRHWAEGIGQRGRSVPASAEAI